MWPFHKHRWKVVGITLGTSTFLVKGDITQVKHRCLTCGLVRTEIINGHWTREELGLEEL